VQAKKNRVIILGGGPTGLAAAWQLAEHGVPVVVLEKDSEVGGMAKTMEFDGCKVDFGPHIFHVRDTEESKKILQKIRKLLDEEPLLLNHKAQVFLQGKMYHYPWQVIELIMKLDFFLSVRVLWDYGIASVKHILSRDKTFRSFEDWGVKNVGRTLFDLAIGRYSSKVWGLPTSEISTRQAQRVAKINLRVLILRMLGVNADPVAHFNKYIYPQGGIGTLYEKMAKEIMRFGGEIVLNAEVCQIHRNGTRIRSIEYKRNNKVEVVEPDMVINTLPLAGLVKMFVPELSDRSLQAARNLFCRSLQLVYVAIKRPQFSSAHWTYLVDDEYRSNRFSEQKSVNPMMVPKDKTVLCFEISCTIGDTLSKANAAELLEIVVKDAEKAGIFNRSEIVSSKTILLENVYPVYRVGFEDILSTIFDELHALNNFATIGRHGLFLNNSMDDNTIMASTLASRYVDGSWDNQAWYAQIRQYLNDAFAGKK
jgi:protoporphyrinogen oxidase